MLDCSNTLSRSSPRVESAEASVRLAVPPGPLEERRGEGNVSPSLNRCRRASKVPQSQGDRHGQVVRIGRKPGRRRRTRSVKGARKMFQLGGVGRSSRSPFASSALFLSPTVSHLTSSPVQHKRRSMSSSECLFLPCAAGPDLPLVVPKALPAPH